ncbi:g10684 [Coccomyxa viridis]|uniref:G10684 protein n=1 Tax=Coccomyxa viridis TaxID=1274662 RepID=A0ABP1G5W8_9CHLO
MRLTASKCVLISLAVLLPATSLGFTAITLTSQDFESKTQAATGQTTGIWFVLFTSSGEPSLQHLKESWDEAALSQLTESVPVYHAVVDVDQQPHLADRFGVQGLPSFLLFRNRKMYKYNGEDTGAESLTAFAREGYKGTAALEVPKEISPLDIALKRLQGNVPMAVGAAACAFLGVTAAMLWKQGRAEAVVAADKKAQAPKKRTKAS